jgi:hypothetical protein
MFNGNDCIVVLQKLPALQEDQYYDAGSIDTMMPAWRAFFHLCQASLDTIVSHELPAQFLSALADANLPCLRTVRIDRIVFLADSPDELQALQVVEQKFSGVEWKVHEIEAPLATLMEMKGMAVAQCVEHIYTDKPGLYDLDDLWFDELSHAFPRAAIHVGCSSNYGSYSSDDNSYDAQEEEVDPRFSEDGWSD